jgi:competence protein ComEC
MADGTRDLQRLLILMQVLCGQVLGCGLPGGRPVLVLLAALVFLGGAVVTGVVSSPRSVILRSLLPLFLGFAWCAPLGWAQQAQGQRLLDLAANLSPEEATFQGLITSPLVHRQQRCHFQVAPDFLAEGSLACAFRTPACPHLRQGDRVRLRGLPTPFPVAKNPGERDQREGLARRGLVGRVKLVYPPLLLATAVVPPGPLDRARQRLYQPPPPGPVSRETFALGVSMVLGDRSLLSQELINWFRASGATHLLAISGLNLAITWVFVLALLHTLLALLPWGQRLRPLPYLGAALVVLFQTLLSGCQPSCLRACTMLLYLGAARMLDREPRALEGLLLAAVCNLATDPFALEDPGFQLSMAATAGIMVAMSRHRFRGLRGLLPGTLAVSLVASALTSPISAWHFHQVPPLAFLLTLPLLLVFSPVLIAVQLQLLTQAVFGHCPWPLATLADFLAQGFLAALEATWDLGPLLFVTRHRLPGLTLLCLALALPLMMSRPWPRRLPAAIGGLLALGLWLWTLAASGPPTTAQVHLFHCGKGNATLLELPGAGRLLLDAGPPGCGRRVLLPFLARQGISHLDALILSHGHDDHFGGLAELGLFLLPDRVFFPDTKAAWRALRGSIPNLPPDNLVPLPRGVYQRLLPGGLLQLHSPGPPARARDENDASLLLFLTWRKAGLVFPGDLGWNGWRRLADRIPHDPVHLLQVPHHGSPSPVLSPIIQYLTPQFLWIFSDRRPQMGGFFGDSVFPNDPHRSTLLSGEVGYCHLDLGPAPEEAGGWPAAKGFPVPHCPLNDARTGWGVGGSDPF